MKECEKHKRQLSGDTFPPFECPDCRRAERLKDCAQGRHYYAPPRGRDGLRWCYGCGKTIHPDDFFADALRTLIE